MVEERAVEVEKYGAKAVHETKLPRVGLKDTENF
jgi:hypothetical protein